MSDTPPSMETSSESRRQLATLLSNLPGMAYRARIDPNWPMEFASEGSRSLCGYRPEELIGGEPQWGDLLDPEDREAVWRYVLAAIERRQAFTLTYRITTASGHRRWVWEQGRAVYDDSGRPLAIEGFITDITERRSAEERLRRSNRLYAVLSRINELIVRVRQPRPLLEEACRIAVEEGRFRQAWVAMRDETERHRLNVMASYGDKDGLLETVLGGRGHLSIEEGHVARSITSGRHQIVARLEMDSRPEPWREALLARNLRSAASFPLLVGERVVGCLNLYSDTSAPDEEEIRLLLALTADLSFALDRAEEERRMRSLQADLAKARSVETIGRLSGTLAHDFNNILMVIDACTESLGRICGEGRGRKEIDQIQTACSRGSDLTRRLLSFGRKQETGTRLLDVGFLVTEARSLLSKVLGESVRLSIRVGEGEHPVDCDATQLEQVLMNMAINARDAMPGGGDFSITVDMVEARDPLAVDEVVSGPYVRLTLEDTGPGLSPEVRERAFEPFFTTKPPKVGSGLGLSIASDLARRSGGWIHAPEQAPGGGAKFEIYLPKASI